MSRGESASSQQSPRRLRLGTRGSSLALEQVNTVAHLIRHSFPDIEVETVVVRTQGDVDQTSPLAIIGGQGVFTSALSVALAGGSIDIAVHSAKDVPTVPVPGLCLAAFLNRVDPCDVLVTRHRCHLHELPANPRIGTSSRRRAVQLLAARPDAQIIELRGNVDSRLRKARADDLDGIVIAAAGLARLDRVSAISEALPLDRFVPSPGQGALALEVRAGDEAVITLVKSLRDESIHQAVHLERVFLRHLGAGCSMPVAVYVNTTPAGWRMRAMMARGDGSFPIWREKILPTADPEEAITAIADAMAREVGRGERSRAIASVPDLERLRVVITRPRMQAQALFSRLRAERATVHLAPMIEVQTIAENPALDDAVSRLVNGAYDWVVFTSANAVGPLVERLAVREQRLPDSTRVAVVGLATASTAYRHGITPTVVADPATSEGLGNTMASLVTPGQRVLYLHGSMARPDFEKKLASLHLLVEAIVVYQTLPVPTLDPEIRTLFESDQVDAFTVSSPSAVSQLVHHLGADHPRWATTALVALGPTTANAARNAGLPLVFTATETSDEGLVQVIHSIAAKRKTRQEQS